MKILQLILYFTSVVCNHQQRIGEGVELSDPTMFPFYALFTWRFIENNLTYMAVCGGSLIHPEWILTAGHCLPNNLSEFEEIIKKKEKVIFMGTVYKSLYDSFGQNRSVAEHHRHPDFMLVQDDKGDLRKLVNDIALLKANKPFKLSDTVDVIALSTTFRKCKFGIAIGLGSTDWTNMTKQSHIVKYAKMAIQSESTPNQSSTIFVTVSKIGDTSNHGDKGYSLSGDSGGPFICDDVVPPLLIGVTSMQANDTENQLLILNFFERIDYYIGFIKKYVPLKEYRTKTKSVANELKSRCTIWFLYVFLLFILCNV